MFLIPIGTISPMNDSISQTGLIAEGSAMDTSERFLKFAAECEAMAKFSHGRENKKVWSGLAQRWIRCAALVDHQYSNNHGGNLVKRRPRVAPSSAH
jgi:hypothetical protein